jgi:hypothetical protein
LGDPPTLDEQTELLREIRDLLRVIAEPALGERDKKLRATLIEIVGKSNSKAKAVLLMNGLKSQAEIRKESGMDHGNLSRMVSALRSKDLIKGDERHPKLVISIQSNFFENLEQTR